MKTFADPSFFRLIHVLIDEVRADMRRTQWTHRGVSWNRIHHSFTGPFWGFGVHQYLLVKPGSNGWSLLVVRENWWSTADDTVLRSIQWAKPLSGRRGHIWDCRYEGLRVMRGSMPVQLPRQRKIADGGS